MYARSEPGAARAVPRLDSNLAFPHRRFVTFAVGTPGRASTDIKPNKIKYLGLWAEHRKTMARRKGDRQAVELEVEPHDIESGDRLEPVSVTSAALLDERYRAILSGAQELPGILLEDESRVGTAVPVGRIEACRIEER